ncbi:MAG: hypothetical protein H6732_01135 [Alphaproteobacteria bacterium]|nr:hypothetical protein [Alphaproteobacteria bacterium]
MTSAPEGPAGPAPWVERLGGRLLVGGALALLIVRAWVSGFTYTVWADRDLARAWHVLRDLPVTGAELSQGSTAAIPGGAQYWLMAPVTWLTGDPAAVFQQALLQDAVGVVLLGLLAGRAAGPVAAGLAMALTVLAPATVATAWRLWNPSFLGLFVAMACVGAVGLARGDGRRAAVLWALGTGLGAQMHLQGGTAGLGLLVGAVLVRPREVLRQLPLALAVLVVLYAPFLLHEATDGATAGRAMLDQPAVRQLADPSQFWRGAGADARASAALLMGTWQGMRDVPDPTWLDPVRVPAAWLGGLAALAAPCALLPAVRRRVGEDLTLLGPLAAAAWLAVGTLLFDPQLHVTLPINARYLAVAVPAVAVLGGVGAARLLQALRPRGAVQAGMVAWLVGGLGWRAAEQVGRWQEEASGLNGWPAFDRRLRELQDLTSLGLPELAGRTVVAGVAGGSWSSVALDGVDFLLAREGADFPGSQPPPCFVVLVGAPLDAEAAALEEDVRTHLSDAWDAPVVEELGRLSGSERVLRVEHAGTTCPSTLVDRYVLPPAEAEVRRLGLGRAPGEVVVQPLPGGTRFVGVVPEDDPGAAPLLVGLDVLRAADGTLDLVLHAEALRGSSFNIGWLGSRLVGELEVVLQGADGAEVRVPLATRLVGFEAAATPLAARGVRPPAGPVRMALHLRPQDLGQGIMELAERPDAPAGRAALTWPLGALPR